MSDSITTDDSSTDIQIGDIALDLCQGRPVHVVDDTGQTAAEWSDANDYDLTGNYGNNRLDAAATDRVFDVVYCSSAKSEPSKTYAFPESRLLRIETERATEEGLPVRERVEVELLEDLFAALIREGNQRRHEFDMVQQWLARSDRFDEGLVTDAAELAESAEDLRLSEGETDD
jgi:hypothetical protein